MKKYAILMIILALTVKSFGQNPDLYQTWYLYTMTEESGDITNIENSVPPIFPELTILSTLEYNGEAVCNEFNGSFEYVISDDRLKIIDFNSTSNQCPGFMMFEGSYIGAFEIIESLYGYTITTEPNGDQRLDLGGGPFISFVFRNKPILGAPKFKKDAFSMYPNPTSDLIYISSESKDINELRLYTIEGKDINMENDLQSLDLSGLNSGTYFLKITTSDGDKTIRRIIKK